VSQSFTGGLAEQAAGRRTLAAMDLRTWISTEHESLRERFERGIAGNVAPNRWRERAGDAGSSIAWLVLHAAWHEDLGMQSAVLGQPPLLAEWRERVGLAGVPPTTGLSESEQPGVTAALDLGALTGYAAAVHEATDAWVRGVDMGVLDDEPAGVSRLGELAGVAQQDVPWLYSIWAGKSIGWFVQWEAIGHRQGHLGEMTSVRSRLGLNPF
jgi:hypothetical protein